MCQKITTSYAKIAITTASCYLLVMQKVILGGSIFLFGVLFGSIASWKLAALYYSPTTVESKLEKLTDKITQKIDQGLEKNPIEPLPPKKNENRVFYRLTLEEQRFVIDQRALAFEHYKKQEFDQAILEIQKVFKLVDDYEDCREIERYAIEGKAALERRLSEKARIDPTKKSATK